MAIAAAAIIVVGGGTAFMLWRAHGTPPAPPQQRAATVRDSSHAGNGDTSVTHGTEAPVIGHNTDTASATPPAERQPTHQAAGSGPVSASSARTAPDTAAIDRELGTLLDAIGDAQAAPRAIQRAQEIYREERLPPLLRAEAAATAASGLYGLKQVGAACEWMAKAIQSNAKQSYIISRTNWGCSP